MAALRLRGLSLIHILLLDDIHAFIRRYVVLTDDQLTAISLWVAHTYAIDAATQTPYLNVNSAVLQCGKSRLLEVLEMIAHDAHVWIRPSEAVVYRLSLIHISSRTATR